MTEVELNTEAPAKRGFKDFLDAKRSRLVFFVLNLALVIPFLVQNYSHEGLVATFLLMLVAFFFFVIKPKDTTVAAIRDIPLLLFLNICVCIVVSYRSIIGNFFSEELAYALDSMSSEYAVPMIVCLLLSFFLRKKHKLLWLRFAGKTVVGACIILQMWPVSSSVQEEIYPGNTLLAFYILVAIAWFTFCMFSGLTDPSANKRNCRLTNLLLVFLLLFSTAGYGVMQMAIPQMEHYLLTVSTGALAWWKVLLSAVVLVGCAVVVYDHEADTVGPDALMLCFVAGAMVILRVLVGNFFNFSWIVFAAFLFSAYNCLRNELRRKKTLRLDNVWYAGIHFAAALLVIWLLKAGLWINLAIIILYTSIFYVTVGKGTHKTHPLRHWLTILSAPAVFALAYICHRRFSPDAMGMVVLSFAVFAAVMLILSLPHPDKLAIPREYKILLCVFLAVLCLLAVSRYGSKVNIQMDTAEDMAVVEIVPRGKDNGIQSVTYYWSSKTGAVTVPVEEMAPGGGTFPIQGEVLTVNVTDSKGVVTTRKAWYPGWLLVQ